MLPTVMEDARRAIMLSRLVDQLAEETLSDPLTGLPNRRAIFEATERMKGSTSRTRARLLPKDMALFPPACICLIKKIQTPISSIMGNQDINMFCHIPPSSSGLAFRRVMTASYPSWVARIRSYALGLPPRWTCPSVVTRRSNPRRWWCSSKYCASPTRSNRAMLF